MQQKRFDDVGVKPDDIRTYEDVVKLPLVDKDVFRTGYPLKLNCVDEKRIVEMHISSGSKGTPVVMSYTLADIKQWGKCMGRCYRMAGAMPGDVLQITPSFGLFNGGFGFYHDGIHVWEDHYIVEIINPDTEKHVEDGEEGGLVVTSLTRKALPIIRFRTGDLTKIQSRDKCSCGRTHIKIVPIEGRIDDMIIVKGVNFFPRQVE